MITKKRLALIAVLPLTIGVLAMLPPRPGVTKATFDRIQDGLTLSGVEELPGRENGGDIEGTSRGVWKANDGSIVCIRFVDDCVFGKLWFDSDETILDKIRRWLHLPKGK